MTVIGKSVVERLDFVLLSEGPCHLYFKKDLIKRSRDWFVGQSYELYEFDCLDWNSVSEMHQDLSSKLNFPDYYGNNLDAFNDCLSGMCSERGLVFIFYNFDHFTKKSVSTAQGLLDIIARNSYVALLLGRKFLALVQSNDPKISFAPVGAMTVQWNSEEWMDKNRGL